MLQIIFEISFKNASALENYFALTLFLPFFPLALVSCVIDLINTIAVPEPIFDFTFINTSIGPLIYSFACNPIISKLAFIYNAIGPGEFACAVKEPVIEIPLVSIPIFECN